MRTILIPVSRSASAEKIKKHLAILSQPNDIIYLLHVVTIPPTYGVMDSVVINPDTMVENLRREEEKDLNHIASQLRTAGYTVETHIPVGFFEQELITVANHVNPAFILMFTGGAHDWLDRVVGTSTSHVFQKLKPPVFVIPEDAEVTGYKKAEVALDMEHDHYEALQQVFDLADQLKMELSFVKIDSNMQLDVVKDGSILNGLQKAYPGRIPFVTHRQNNDPVKGLEQYAEESGADLIVVFTTRRNFIDSLFHKSVSRNLVLHAKKPLLICHY